MDYQSIRKGGGYRNMNMSCPRADGTSCRVSGIRREIPVACSMDDSVSGTCGSGYCITDVPSLAMVYGPCQEFRDIFDLETGFYRGTIFCQLYKPWMPNCGSEGGCR